MAYVRGALSAVAAILIALLGPGLLNAVRNIGQQKATGLGVIWGGFLESLLSPQFWILAVSFFGLFFAASRLNSKVLRVILFWTPTLVCSTLGLGLIAFFMYFWMHFRRS